MADDKQKEETGSKIQIIVAVIAVVGTLGGALFANWEKIFNQPNTSTSAAQTLTVNADSINGTPYTNAKNTRVQVTFKANHDGRWLAIPKEEPGVPDQAKGYLSAKGDPNFRPKEMPCPNYPFGGLVVLKDIKDCRAYGEEGEFELRPQETVYFKMNDVFGKYGDNEGSIDVQVSVLKN